MSLPVGAPKDQGEGSWSVATSRKGRANHSTAMPTTGVPFQQLSLCVVTHVKLNLKGNSGNRGNQCCTQRGRILHRCITLWTTLPASVSQWRAAHVLMNRNLCFLKNAFTAKHVVENSVTCKLSSLTRYGGVFIFLFMWPKTSEESKLSRMVSGIKEYQTVVGGRAAHLWVPVVFHLGALITRDTQCVLSGLWLSMKLVAQPKS